MPSCVSLSDEQITQRVVRKVFCACVLLVGCKSMGLPESSVPCVCVINAPQLCVLFDCRCFLARQKIRSTTMLRTRCVVLRILKKYAHTAVSEDRVLLATN